jgi:hypothetical protein
VHKRIDPTIQLAPLDLHVLDQDAHPRCYLCDTAFLTRVEQFRQSALELGSPPRPDDPAFEQDRAQLIRLISAVRSPTSRSRA